MQSKVASVPPAENRIAPTILAVWVASRLITSVGAIVFSGLRPITAIERAIAVWPPSGDLGLWLYRLLLAPWLRWDAVWFRAILVDGMIAGNGSTAFHPLYDLLSTPLYWLGLDPLLSLMITSSLAALGSFWIFHRYAGLDLPRRQCGLALILLATFPVALIYFAPYRESLFLFFSVLVLYEIRRRRWLPAALAAFAASLTRQQGALLIVPMLWQAWEDSGRSISGVLKVWRGWAAALSAPAGLLAWTAYRIGVLHEGTLDMGSWQGFFYSALLSPSAKATAPVQALMWPWDVLVLSLPRLVHGPDIEDIMAVALGFAFLGLLVFAWRHMQPGDRLYALVITLVSFSYFSGTGRIYAALPRHLMLAAPVFVGLAAALRKSWQQYSVVVIQLALQIFMLFLYVAKFWIP